VQSRFVFNAELGVANVSRYFVVQFSALIVAQMISDLDAEANSYYRVLFVAIILPLITFFVHRGWTFARS